MGSGSNALDHRDVDNRYEWSDPAADPQDFIETGALFFDWFLYDTNTFAFGGSFGWRIPSMAELQTILLPEPYPCPTSPCIDAVFGPTQSDFYWSATTSAGFPFNAWGVYFGDGNVNLGNKSGNDYVRAVRGGLW